MQNFIVISGCSGGGKSALLAELGRRGHAVVEEPGRRIIAEELASGGAALPWIDMAAFARRAIRMALADRESASGAADFVFFDRGLIDAAAALEHLTGEPALEKFGRTHRYGCIVFLTPPWPEIYRHDKDRRHDFDAARAEHDRLVVAYARLGYDARVLPLSGVAERAELVLGMLGHQAGRN